MNILSFISDSPITASLCFPVYTPAYKLLIIITVYSNSFSFPSLPFPPFPFPILIDEDELLNQCTNLSLPTAIKCSGAAASAECHSLNVYPAGRWLWFEDIPSTLLAVLFPGVIKRTPHVVSAKYFPQLIK